MWLRSGGASDARSALDVASMLKLGGNASVRSARETFVAETEPVPTPVPTPEPVPTPAPTPERADPAPAEPATAGSGPGSALRIDQLFPPDERQNWESTMRARQAELEQQVQGLDEPAADAKRQAFWAESPYYVHDDGTVYHVTSYNPTTNSVVMERTLEPTTDRTGVSAVAGSSLTLYADGTWERQRTVTTSNRDGAVVATEQHRDSSALVDGAKLHTSTVVAAGADGVPTFTESRLEQDVGGARYSERTQTEYAGGKPTRQEVDITSPIVVTGDGQQLSYAALADADAAGELPGTISATEREDTRTVTTFDDAGEVSESVSEYWQRSQDAGGAASDKVYSKSRFYYGEPSDEKFDLGGGKQIGWNAIEAGSGRDLPTAWQLGMDQPTTDTVTIRYGDEETTGDLVESTTVDMTRSRTSIKDGEVYGVQSSTYQGSLGVTAEVRDEAGQVVQAAGLQKEHSEVAQLNVLGLSSAGGLEPIGDNPTVTESFDRAITLEDPAATPADGASRPALVQTTQHAARGVGDTGLVWDDLNVHQVERRDTSSLNDYGDSSWTLGYPVDPATGALLRAGEPYEIARRTGTITGDMRAGAELLLTSVGLLASGISVVAPNPITPAIAVVANLGAAALSGVDLVRESADVLADPTNWSEYDDLLLPAVGTGLPFFAARLVAGGARAGAGGTGAVAGALRGQADTALNAVRGAQARLGAGYTAYADEMSKLYAVAPAGGTQARAVKAALRASKSAPTPATLDGTVAPALTRAEMHTKRKLAKQLAGIPRTQQPVYQGYQVIRTQNPPIYEPWWEYNANGRRIIIVQHNDGSVHAGTVKSGQDQSKHLMEVTDPITKKVSIVPNPDGAPKYYDDLGPNGTGLGHIGDD